MAQAKAKTAKTAVDWDAIPHPVFLWGNRHISHRDPAGHYHEGVFRVFYSHVRREPGGALLLSACRDEEHRSRHLDRA